MHSGKIRFVRRRSTAVGEEVPPQVDFVFIDADHSLSGISADWAFWSDRVVGGGVVGLHDTLAVPNERSGRLLGSHIFFRDNIRHDVRFEVVGQRDTLCILRKL